MHRDPGVLGAGESAKAKSRRRWQTSISSSGQGASSISSSTAMSAKQIRRWPRRDSHLRGSSTRGERSPDPIKNPPHLSGTMKTGVDDWWVANGRSAKKTFAELLSKAESPFVPRIRSTRELEQMKFAELRWIVPGWISAGLSGLVRQAEDREVVSGAPTRACCCERHPGARLLRDRDALVVALEDTDVRIKTRMARLNLRGIEGLRVTTSWPKGDDAYVALERDLQEHPETKLIVIDTLQRFRRALRARAKTSTKPTTRNSPS